MEDYSTFVPFDYGNPLDVSKRNLPHWEQPGTTYFITFRLADSIPLATVRKIKMEREIWLSSHEEPLSDEDWLEYNKLFSQRIHDLLDSGAGECVLADRRISDIVKNALSHFDGEKYTLGAWVIMPNHTHIVVTPLDKHSLERITHSWKSFTANEINKKLQRKVPLWQGESFDHIIRNMKQLRVIEKYILANPAKANLKSGFQYSH
ncbi:MAG: transposase [Victivallales bacterium]|nr:transposase [Victivallales bacterium]